jgi:SNF2 family DNA or RNA helicase
MVEPNHIVKNLIDLLLADDTGAGKTIMTGLLVKELQSRGLIDDEERDQLDNILTDPRKFKLFTTAESIQEIREETGQVKHLCSMADELLGNEEEKLVRLRKLLSEQGALEKGEKLVIFTEHRDTLDYLQQKLENNGKRMEQTCPTWRQRLALYRYKLQIKTGTLQGM